MLEHFSNVMKELMSTVPNGLIDPKKGAIKTAVLSFLAANGVNTVSLQKRIQRSKLYDSRLVEGKSVVEFFEGSFDPNATNFTNNTFTFPEDEPKIIYGIWVEVGANPNIEQTDWALGANDANIKNAVASLVINGTTVVKNIPLADALAGMTDRDLGFIPFTTPVLVKGQESLKVVVAFKNPYATVSQNMRISLESIGLVS